MGPGRVTVSTDQLHGAAQTLARVDGALAQRGDLNVGARDLGSHELSAAVADFCQKAGNLATLFSASVGAAAATTHGAAERYGHTELVNATGFHGRP
jgi:hypothetical protein